MYKIIKGEKNIGMFMMNYFDELWENALTPKKLYQYISSGNVAMDFVHIVQRGGKMDAIHVKDWDASIKKYVNN